MKAWSPPIPFYGTALVVGIFRSSMTATVWKNVLFFWSIRWKPLPAFPVLVHTSPRCWNWMPCFWIKTGIWTTLLFYIRISAVSPAPFLIAGLRSCWISICIALILKHRRSFLKHGAYHSSPLLPEQSIQHKAFTESSWRLILQEVTLSRFWMPTSTTIQSSSVICWKSVCWPCCWHRRKSCFDRTIGVGSTAHLPANERWAFYNELSTFH